MNFFTVAVGSKNPVKLNAAMEGMKKATFRDILAEGFDVLSGVPDQPKGDEETCNGARNRALAAWEEFSTKNGKPPDFSIGLEGGISECVSGMECFAWICTWDGKKLGSARTASFTLPPAIAKLVRDGMELGDN